MGSLSYNVELEGGQQRKVHVDYLICQAPGCAPVPVVTGEEALNTSEPSNCDTVTPLDQPVTPQECGTVEPLEQPVRRQSSQTIRAPERLIEQL